MQDRILQKMAAQPIFSVHEARLMPVGKRCRDIFLFPPLGLFS